MLIGSLGALRQTDLKRLMAYSTINHIGFILMALIPGSEDGITSICIYLIFYITMNLGIFLFILNMQRDQISVTSIKDLAGLYRSQPLMAGCISIILFSMAGIPPMAGFIGKLIILNIIIDNKLFFLAIIAILITKRNPEISPWVSFLICSYPIIETLVSIYRKTKRHGHHFTKPDRLHLHMLVYRDLARNISKKLKLERFRNPTTSILMLIFPIVFCSLSAILYLHLIAIYLLIGVAFYVYIKVYKNLSLQKN